MILEHFILKWFTCACVWYILAPLFFLPLEFWRYVQLFQGATSCIEARCDIPENKNINLCYPSLYIFSTCWPIQKLFKPKYINKKGFHLETMFAAFSWCSTDLINFVRNGGSKIPTKSLLNTLHEDWVVQYFAWLFLYHLAVLAQKSSFKNHSKLTFWKYKLFGLSPLSFLSCNCWWRTKIHHHQGGCNTVPNYMYSMMQ